MAITKIQAESMNLADTYDFTGTVSGAGGGIFESQLIHVRDERSNGTDGGSSISGSNTRTLNTIKTNEITGASLGGSQITLPSGTYYLNAGALILRADSQRTILYNVTDSSTELYGLTHLNGGGDTQTIFATVSGRFTISAQKVFEIRSLIDNAKSGDGYGVQAGDGNPEVYVDVQIWKVA